ncbi:hypothetical protein Tco_0998747 [Tanacetum coccineum]
MASNKVLASLCEGISILYDIPQSIVLHLKILDLSLFIEVHNSQQQHSEPQHTLTTASQSNVEPIPVPSSSQPKKTHKHRNTKRKATEISQSSGPTTIVADESVYEERGDNMERAATTVTSLDVEQDIGDRPAQARVLALENIKTAQDLEITSLKKRVKKLEKKKKARTPQLKRRLFKGRNEIGQDEEISWFQEDEET